MPKEALKRDYEYLLWLLSRRDYPEKKLREKLRARKVIETDIEALLAEVKEAGYFSEERFRKARARQLTRRGEGPRAIKSKVKAETGIEMPESEMHQVYEDLGTTDYEVLHAYLTKEQSKLLRSQRFEPKQIHQKLTERAMRKGFSYDLIKKVILAINT